MNSPFKTFQENIIILLFLSSFQPRTRSRQDAKMHFINFENEIYPSKDEIYPSKNDMNSGSNHSNSSYSNRPGPKILLGVTGSVAAVKSPEIAVRLALGVNAEVKVLLTKGGENFWEKAEGYNKKYWDMMQDIIQRAYLSDDDLLREEKGSITIYCEFCLID